MVKRPRTSKVTGTPEEMQPPKGVDVPGDNAPVKRINPRDLAALGKQLGELFTRYAGDRTEVELVWLRNLRQYLGIYDEDIEKQLTGGRSNAYPRITRVKVISVLSRLMNLMFPGNEDNWTLTASPNPDLAPAEVQQAIAKQQARDQAAGAQKPIDIDYVLNAMTLYAQEQADKLVAVIKDQLQEIGGDQTLDVIQLNRSALLSGIMYGCGVVRGPFARETKVTTWELGQNNIPVATITDGYKPQYEVLPVWDFYPDMAAKTLRNGDGYFTREVMSKSQLRKLANRKDFFEEPITAFIKSTPDGNYKERTFEATLRSMGVKSTVNAKKNTPNGRYEVIVWHGPISGADLRLAGAEVADDKVADDISAEVWLLDGNVIKAVMNPWAKLDEDVRMIHTFLFDEDDTSPMGKGLPNVMRDSQMAVCAMTRMFLDNASVVCGPNLEVNTALLRPDQDLSSLSAYKFWYRDDNDQTAQFPAVRNIEIESHLDALQKGIQMFLQFADAETFVGPATGGDMSKAPSEPMRTAAGASMLRGDAALPFKDIVRNFDSFTQSWIESMVAFNRVFNPQVGDTGDFNVVARGATSLIAKEVRGMQVDALAQTLKPEEMLHIDERKLVEARLKVRDLGDLLVPAAEADRRKAQQGQTAADQAEQAKALSEAQTRNLLSQAFKNIAQGNKNAANADATSVESALKLMEQGVKDALTNLHTGGPGSAGPGAAGDEGGALPPAVVPARIPGDPRSTVLSLPARAAAAGGG